MMIYASLWWFIWIYFWHIIRMMKLASNVELPEGMLPVSHSDRSQCKEENSQLGRQQKRMPKSCEKCCMILCCRQSVNGYLLDPSGDQKGNHLWMVALWKIIVWMKFQGARSPFTGRFPSHVWKSEAHAPPATAQVDTSAFEIHSAMHAVNPESLVMLQSHADDVSFKPLPCPTDSS